jgi:hypothetical protein
MKFTHYNLGHLDRGSVVIVTLAGSAANVRLMDSTNLSSYKAGRRHQYIGGLAKSSPVRLQVPRSGTWHVTVDMQGLRGTVRSGVQVVRGDALRPLPAINEAPLRSVPTLVRDADHDLAPTPEAPDGRGFDVFISHASEDKDDVVRPLANALREIGDSLRRKIDRGLGSSRFGVVVLSQAFFGKGWPEYELDGLVTKAVSGDQVLLPVWHNVSKSEVIGYSPSLADRLARSTSTNTVEEIAAEIAEVVRLPKAA